MQQIPLPFRLDDGATLASFVAGPNQGVLDFLERFQRYNDEPQVYLWSAEARGKTHLAQGLCLSAGTLGLRASYLPLDTLQGYGPDILEGLEHMDLVSLDDLDQIVGQPDWDEALFHLINRCRNSGSRLLMTAAQLPDELPIGLADLRSRLHWGPVFHLKPLDEVALKAVIDRFAQDHGMDLEPAVVDYLIGRYERSVGNVVKQLQLLDERGLEAKRKITIPFVRDTLPVTKL